MGYSETENLREFGHEYNCAVFDVSCVMPVVREYQSSVNCIETALVLISMMLLKENNNIDL